MSGHELTPGDQSSEIEKFVLKRQIEAVARVIFLVGKDKEMSIDEVTASLARAEQEANFMCGFVGLNADVTTKDRILKEMIEKGYALLENNTLILTEAGKEFSQVPLPPPIEENLS